MGVIEDLIEANRLSAQRQRRYETLAYQWHLQRRWRLQGRITDEEWLDWAYEYAAAMDNDTWRQWCYWQINRVKHTQG